LGIVKSDYFQSKILSIRKKYQIPEKGFDTEKIYYAVPASEKDYKGKGWKERAIKIKGYDIWKGEDIKRTKKAEKAIADEIDKICGKYSFHYLDWGDIIEDYLYFNKLEKNPSHLYYSNSYNLCMLTDLAEIADEPFGKRLTKVDNEIFPIAIRISPYASERDIIDYIKKMLPMIKDYQKSYIKSDVKIGKIKKKNPAIQERNDFIYKNRDLSQNELRKLVEEKFKEVLDYEYIGKIKSQEIKKRKEV
jgi:hypothetical protein